MSRFIAAKIALVALYAAYVAGPNGSAVLALAVVAAVVAGVVLSAEDDVGIRGACAAGALVLAVMHVRLLAPDAPLVGLQVGLATAVAGSAAATLVAERARRWRVAPILLSGAMLVAAVVVMAASTGFWSPWFFGLAGLAFVRPLGAVGAALAHAGLHAGGRDPCLWWQAEVAVGEGLR